MNLLLFIAKMIPGSLGEAIRAYLQDAIGASNDNEEAKRVQADKDHMENLMSRSAAGDEAAQEEIRRRESE